MTYLPELGTNLIPTLPTLDMKNLSHGAAEREGKKEFSPNKGSQAKGGRKVGGDQGTRGEEKRIGVTEVLLNASNENYEARGVHLTSRRKKKKES